MFLFLVSLANADLCEQKNSGCCKGEICQEAQAICEIGYTPTFMGCDDNCSPIINCIKEKCISGGYQCNGYYVQKCNDVTGKWFDAQYCEYGCRYGECVEIKAGSIKYFMNAGDTVDFNGKKVSLIDVVKEGDSIKVEVGGIGEYVSDIEMVNDVEITVLETFYGPELSDRSATIALYTYQVYDKPNSPLDFSNYPHMLIRDGKILATFVVGADAPASDTLAAVDVSTGVQLVAKDVQEDVIPVIKLDTEISNPLNRNIVSIGNPCNNKVSDILLGTPYTCLKGFTDGEGIIRLHNFNNYVQILIAGYSDQDTRKAAKVLANWREYDLSGKELRVTGDYASPLINQEPLAIVVEPEEVPQPAVSAAGGGSGKIIRPMPDMPVNIIQPCDGCLLDSVCMPFGTRISRDVPLFCDINKEFLPQKELNEDCQNNYECLTNQCSNRRCIDLESELRETRSLVQRLLSWFERVFG